MDIERWMERYQAEVLDAFGGRVRYIGLQGSYGRGEATEASDIDVVLILDTCTPEDLARYQAVVRALPAGERACGFVSGAAEVAAWDRGELFQFRRDTTDIWGRLADLIPPEGPRDAGRALHAGACEAYHLCGHALVHGCDRETLAGAYKAAVFLLQAKAYLETGHYCRRHCDLGGLLSGADLELLQTAQALRAGTCGDPIEALASRLFCWSRDVLGSARA